MAKITPPFACAYCGKPAQRRTERVGNPHRYGNTGQREAAEAAGTTLETWRYRGNGMVLRSDWHRPTEYNLFKPYIAWVNVWDGETWELARGDFCRTECAEDFARAALRAGYRMPRRAA